MIYKIAGVLGLILIIAGNIFTLKEKTRKKYSYPLFLAGGIGLLIYSISIKDIIFVVLQSVFILIALYEVLFIKK